MSNLQALGMIGALFIPASFFMLCAGVVVRNTNAGILGGVVGGAPVSYEFRWLLIWNFELPMTMSTGVIALVFGFLFLQIGSNIEDAATATLAQGCAVTFFAFSALFLLLGPLTVADTVRQFRKIRAEAD